MPFYQCIRVGSQCFFFLHFWCSFGSSHGHNLLQTVCLIYIKSTQTKLMEKRDKNTIFSLLRSFLSHFLAAFFLFHAFILFSVIFFSFVRTFCIALTTHTRISKKNVHKYIEKEMHHVKIKCTQINTFHLLDWASLSQDILRAKMRKRKIICQLG